MAAAAVERGEAIPETLIPPILGEVEAPFWEGFTALNQTRDPRMPSPLALTEILAWCDLAGLSDQISRREFLDVVRALDQAWFEAIARSVPARPVDAAVRAADHFLGKPPMEET